MSAGRRLILLLRKNETAQSIAIAMSVASLIIGLVVLFLEWPVNEFRAIADLNYSTIDYDKVTCLSIDSHRVIYNGKDYPDPALAKSIANILSIKRVLPDATYSECPWKFFVVVVPGTTSDMFDGFLPAQYLISVGICERINDEQVNPGNCVNKNVYVFNWSVKPHDLFRIGLTALRPETQDMEVFKVKANDG